MSYGRRNKPKPHSHQFLMIPKGNNMELRFSYSDFGGIHRFDIRQWVRAENSGNMIPTKAGLSIPVDDIDSFMDAITKVIPQVREYAEKREGTSPVDLSAIDVSFKDEPVKDLKPDDLKGDDAWGR